MKLCIDCVECFIRFKMCINGMTWSKYIRIKQQNEVTRTSRACVIFLASVQSIAGECLMLSP